MATINDPYNTTSTSSLIDQQSQQSLAARTAALQKARDEAVNGYTQQKDALPQQYQPLRDQASFQGAKNVNAINEANAGTGQYNSGNNVTAQTANATSTAGNINALSVQQQAQVDKLQQAIAQAQANYGYDLAGATADVESQKLAAQVAQANADKGFGLTQQQIDNQAAQNAASLAQNASQFGVTSGQNQQQINNQAAQSAASLAMQQQQISNQMDQFAQSFGLSKQQFAQAVTQQGLDNAYRNSAFAQDAAQFAAQQGLSRDQLNAQIAQWAQQNSLAEQGLYGYSLSQVSNPSTQSSYIAPTPSYPSSYTYSTGGTQNNSLVTVPTSNGYQTVLAGSVFDPGSPNYNGR